MKKTVQACILFLALALLPVSESSAATGQITQDLKSVVDEVLGLLKNSAYEAPEKKQERDRRIHELANGTFDWEEMARRTLGPHWRSLTTEQQKQFIDIFVGFLENTYLSRVESFLHDTRDFTADNISYLNETVEQGRYAKVETKILLNEKQLPVNYKLIRKTGKWVVYDITIEGVGLVANYRTQFNEILANGTFEDLIKKLKTKQGIKDPLPSPAQQDRP